MKHRIWGIALGAVAFICSSFSGLYESEIQLTLSPSHYIFTGLAIIIWISSGLLAIIVRVSGIGSPRLVRRTAKVAICTGFLATAACIVSILPIENLTREFEASSVSMLVWQLIWTGAFWCSIDERKVVKT